MKLQITHSAHDVFSFYVLFSSISLLDSHHHWMHCGPFAYFSPNYICAILIESNSIQSQQLNIHLSNMHVHTTAQKRIVGLLFYPALLVSVQCTYTL